MRRELTMKKQMLVTAVAAVLMILALMIRPYGMFGKRIIERV